MSPVDVDDTGRGEGRETSVDETGSAEVQKNSLDETASEEGQKNAPDETASEEGEENPNWRAEAKSAMREAWYWEAEPRAEQIRYNVYGSPLACALY